MHENEIGLIRPDAVVENKLGRNPIYLKRILRWKKQNIKIILIENEGINQWNESKKKVTYDPDLAIFWNKNHGHEFNKPCEQKILGSPRSDFLQKKFKSIFKQRKELELIYQINPSYKNITIAFHNSYEDLDQKKLYEISKTRKHIYSENFSFFDIVEHQKIARKKLIEFVENLSNLKQNFNLLVKPHPNDDIKFWNQFKKKYPSVKLMYGAPINDLFCLSDLHIGKSGCSTIPESYVYGLPNIELNFHDDFSKKVLSIDHINLGFQNIEKMKDLNYSLMDIIQKKIPKESKDKYEKKMKLYIEENFHMIDGNRCKEYANTIDIFMSKSNKSKLSSKLLEIIYRALNFFSDLSIKYIKKIFRKYYKYNLIDKRGRYDSKMQMNDEKKYYSLFDQINL